MFSAAQRGQLRAVSLSRIICDNSHITHVPADPFSRTERPEDMLPCSHPLVPPLDLGPWREPDSGESRADQPWDQQPPRIRYGPFDSIEALANEQQHVVASTCSITFQWLSPRLQISR